ncbi:aldose 1-epimerase [Roseivirga pacifica]|uniref:aldose 1-epimerase n=1 Tax=Roseivirga pacifica TaxID=1267423 RepID=UPI003BB1D1EE
MLTEPNRTTVQISNHLSKLTVNPKRGGAIDELVLNGRTIIQPMEGLGYESSLLFPFPNRLAEGKFSFQGRSFELPQNDDGRPNALHGLVHDKAFEVTASSESSVTLVYNYDGSLPYFPFPYSLQVTYTLEATSLEMNVLAKNTGNQMMPWGFGWHPYFLVEKVDECALQLPKVNKIHADDMLLPNGKITEENTYNTATQIKETEFDTCFKLSDKQGLNHTHLYYPDGGLLDIWQEDLFPFIQVYTPADRKTIAIEPMTCGVNAFNSGDELKFLDSGNDWSMRFGLTYNGVE